MQIGTLALFQRFGYDSHWCVEHHFEDYSFCPDNVVYLAHLAAKTRRLRLATGAVILPWNTPLRVAERVALLDQLSNGRVIFGMGRGLSRREYEQFGIDMDTSRERFDEAAPMILRALETGVIEGHGKHYPQPRARIRPQPSRSFQGRVTQVAMSPDSALEAATHAAQMMVFTQKPIEQHEQDFAPYRARFRELHGREAPPPLMAGVVVCHDDPGRAAELARKHIAGYLVTAMHHYELMGDHFKKAKGYEAYGAAVDMLRDMGLEAFSEAYMDAQAWGTPRQILDKLEHWRRVVGSFDLILAVRAAGIPYADAERSLRLFAEQVIPELRHWDALSAA